MALPIRILPRGNSGREDSAIPRHQKTSVVLWSTGGPDERHILRTLHERNRLASAASVGVSWHYVGG